MENEEKFDMDKEFKYFLMNLEWINSQWAIPNEHIHSARKAFEGGFRLCLKKINKTFENHELLLS
jgi:hypothetical protein